MRRLLRALCIAAMVAGVSAVGLPAAAAADDALIRFAHLSPDTPAVDVYVDPVGNPAAAFVLRDVRYGSISAYRRVAPGGYTVAVRARGVATSVPPVLAGRVQLLGGSARAVAMTGRFAAVGLATLPDDHTAPATGRARVRVIDGAATAPSLDLRVGGTPVATRLPFAHAGGYVDVASGPTTVEVTPHGGARTTAPTARTAAPATFAAGAVYSVVVLDRPDGGLDVRTVLDAAGPRTVPVGGVETGAGGTAPDVGGLTAAGAVLAVLVALALISPRRSRLVVAVVAVTAGSVAVFAPAPVPESTPVAVAHRAPAVAMRAVAVQSSLPVRVHIPAVGIDSDLARLGVDGAGALVPSADFAQAGWFTGGPLPGAVGPAVLAGHVDSRRGPAVFFRLGRLHSGDDVLVTRADGTTLRFTVTRVARFAKSAFPTAAVYGPTADPQLRLITCGGSFDRGRRSYVDDVVVFARLR